MNIRDRVKELRRVKAADLRPSPHNWRTHPTEQLDALRGILAEVGYAGASLARELPDGTLELIDGHARAEVSGDATIPVLVLDVTEEEAKKILATFDPIGAMATSDAEKLDALLKSVTTDNDALNALLESLAADNGLTTPEENPETTGQGIIPEKYQILIEFDNETSQSEWLEKLTAEGLACRSLIYGSWRTYGMREGGCRFSTRRPHYVGVSDRRMLELVSYDVSNLSTFPGYILRTYKR